jgi:hypothetical protein
MVVNPMKAFSPHEGLVSLRHSFDSVWKTLRVKPQTLETDRGAHFTALANVTSSGKHEGENTIRILNGKNEYARVYSCCWGKYYNCYGTRIGMYCKALDQIS